MKFSSSILILAATVAGVSVSGQVSQVCNPADDSIPCSSNGTNTTTNSTTSTDSSTQATPPPPPPPSSASNASDASKTPSPPSSSSNNNNSNGTTANNDGIVTSSCVIKCLAPQLGSQISANLNLKSVSFTDPPSSINADDKSFWSKACSESSSSVFKTCVNKCPPNEASQIDPYCKVVGASESTKSSAASLYTGSVTASMCVVGFLAGSLVILL